MKKICLVLPVIFLLNFDFTNSQSIHQLFGGEDVVDSKYGEKRPCLYTGCTDCYSFCGTIKSLCTKVGEYCRKTCGKCDNENDLCQKLQCKNICELNEDKTEASCKCFDGYSKNENGECVDINECEQDDICGNWKEPTCTNQLGSYACSQCKKGFFAFYKRDNQNCCKTDESAQCGLNSYNIPPRIVGGEDAKVSAWPWQAIITFGEDFCGGVYFGGKIIITAAHCFDNGDPDTIFLGVNNMKKNNVHVQQFEVIKKTIHPDYNFPYNDIAVVEIDNIPIESDLIKPICLPNGEVPKVGTKCIATGFGTTSFQGQASDQLQEVDVPIQDIEKCKRNYASKVSYEIDNKGSMVCAGYDEGGKDACQGDSGGPLVCQRENSCNWYLAGITSFGKGCANAQLYGVYTNVTNYEDWIHSTIGNQPFWSSWASEGNCSKRCGKGEQKKVRTCVGGDSCPGENVKFEDCNVEPCPTWSNWMWSACDATCGESTRTGYRVCDVIEGSSVVCEGKNSTVEVCKLKECEASWSSCSVTCGGGTQSNGNSVRVCNQQACRTWSAWTEFSACSVSCGGGERSRTRKCSLETAKIINDECPGESIEKENCNNRPCPAWTLWSDWSACTASCGGGVQTSFRTCVGGNQGEDGCLGNDKKSQVCADQSCPYWGEWTVSGQCSITCGVNEGVQLYTRTCVNGEKGDEGCDEGESEKLEKCVSTKPCPSWSPWSEYSACSVTCGDGTKSRNRYCQYGNVGEDGCVGSTSESQQCNSGDCSASSSCDSEEDSISSCSSYKSLGFCQATSQYYTYMQQNCAKTCCKDFEDSNDKLCVDEIFVQYCRKFIEYCSTNYLQKYCRKTCRKC